MHDQESKETFRKMKKVYIEIYNIHIYFQMTWKFISLTSRKSQMSSYFLPVSNIVEILMALPLIAIYLFNQGVLDFVLKMC